MSAFATVFASAASASPGLRALVDRAWDLEGLADRYEAFVAEFAPLRSLPLGDREAFIARTRLVHLFRGFPQLDPELPEDARAARRGPRERAVETFRVLYESLAEPAQRHFDAAVTP